NLAHQKNVPSRNFNLGEIDRLLPARPGCFKGLVGHRAIWPNQLIADDGGRVALVLQYRQITVYGLVRLSVNHSPSMPHRFSPLPAELVDDLHLMVVNEDTAMVRLLAMAIPAQHLKIFASVVGFHTVDVVHITKHLIATEVNLALRTSISCFHPNLTRNVWPVFRISNPGRLGKTSGYVIKT